MLAKIDVWFSSRKVQKAMAKINPRYLARSPVNILRATKFMTQPLLNRDPSDTEGTRRAFQIQCAHQLRLTSCPRLVLPALPGTMVKLSDRITSIILSMQKKIRSLPANGHERHSESSACPLRLA